MRYKRSHNGALSIPVDLADRLFNMGPVTRSGLPSRKTQKSLPNRQPLRRSSALRASASRFLSPNCTSEVRV